MYNKAFLHVDACVCVCFACQVPDVEAFFKLDFFLGVYHHGMHFTTAVLCYPGLVCRPLAAAAKFLADNDWQHELYELEMVEAAQNAGVEGDEGGSRREACVLVLDSFHGGWALYNTPIECMPYHDIGTKRRNGQHMECPGVG